MSQEINRNLLSDPRKYRADLTWPMRVMQAFTFEKAPSTTLHLCGLDEALRDYPAYLRAEDINTALYRRADEVLKRGCVPEPLQKLITAIYEEGEILASVFGEDMARVKFPGLSPEALSAQIKAFGSLGNLIGFQHVKEFFDVAREQLRLDLFREDGLITQDEFNRGMAATHEKLLQGAHYGVHTHPSLVKLLMEDTRPVTVTRARGNFYPLMPSKTSYTRAAYIASERDYLNEKSHMSAAEKAYHMEDSFHEAMGERYWTASKNKWDEIRSGDGWRKILDSLKSNGITKSSAELRAAMCSAPYTKAVQDAQKAFIGKYGFALLDPQITAEMERSGRYSPAFWDELDRGMHALTGSRTPFAPHVTEAAMRAGAQRDIATDWRPTQPPPPLPSHGETAQKKTPSDGKLPRLQGPSGASSAAEAAEGAGRFTGGRLAFSAIGGLAIWDGLAHLRSSPRDGSNKEAPDSEKKVSFGRVCEVAIGATLLAASWLTKDRSIERTILGR